MNLSGEMYYVQHAACQDALHGVGSIAQHGPTSRSYAAPQVMLAMENARRDRRVLHYAAARAASWLVSDVPKVLEALLFPDNVHTPVCAVML